MPYPIVANQLETDVERPRSHRRSPDQHFHSRTVTGYDSRLRTELRMTRRARSSHIQAEPPACLALGSGRSYDLPAGSGLDARI